MSSWRDAASAESQEDMDNLFNEAPVFAKTMLAKSGEFFPYALAVTQDGETKMVAGYTGSERPPSAEVLTLLGGHRHDSPHPISDEGIRRGGAVWAGNCAGGRAPHLAFRLGGARHLN